MKPLLILICLASDGTRAFDFNGWSDAVELVEVNRRVCMDETPGWDCDLVTIPADFDSYCHDNHHQTADQFPGDIVSRADVYIDYLLDQLAQSRVGKGKATA